MIGEFGEERGIGRWPSRTSSYWVRTNKAQLGVLVSPASSSGKVGLLRWSASVISRCTHFDWSELGVRRTTKAAQASIASTIERHHVFAAA